MTLQIFSDESIGGITESVFDMEGTERDKIRSAIHSGMGLEHRSNKPYLDAIAEVAFIVREMDEDELGDYNEWADVARIQKIREALDELDKETA